MSRATRIAILSIMAGSCALYLYSSARQYRVEALLADPSDAHARLAATLGKSDASAQRLLGRMQLFNELDAASAAQSFALATRLDRYDSAAWLDLAAARQQTGDITGMEEALKQAVAVDPTTPSTHWEAGTLFLSAEQGEQAMAEFKQAVTYGPPLVPDFMRVAWNQTHDAPRILDSLPANQAAFTLALEYFVRQQERASADLTWQRLQAMSGPNDFGAAARYVDLLLRTGSTPQATTIWAQSCTAFRDQHYCVPGNRITNGGFEEPLLYKAFDWQLNKNLKRVTFSVDPAKFYDGSRSLLLEVNGEDAADFGMYQLVPVSPDTRYRWTGTYQPEALITAFPLKLVIDDPATQNVLASSPAIEGTGGWRTFTTDFKTDHTTSLLRLRLLHLPAGDPVRGKLWLDGFRIEAQ